MRRLPRSARRRQDEVEEVVVVVVVQMEETTVEPEAPGETEEQRANLPNAFHRAIYVARAKSVVSRPPGKRDARAASV